VTSFVIRRVVQGIVTVLIVVLAIFVLLQLLPGGPARAILGLQATSAQVAAFNRSQGYDRPLLVQFWDYITRLARGNLGYSFQLNQSVSSLLGQALPKTLVLTIVSTLLAAALAIPLGLFQAVRRNRVLDQLFTGVAFLLYSTPIFFLALLLIIAFSQQLHLFPPVGPQSNSILSVLADPRALFLPVLSLTLVSIAAFSRYTRSSTLDVIGEEFVRTARAKGFSEQMILLRHVVRNTLIPVVTLLGAYIPYLFSGALVVEAIYNYPGAGWLFWNAAQTRDYPVILGVVLVIAVATVAGSLLVDLVYMILDPRVRYV